MTYFTISVFSFVTVNTCKHGHNPTLIKVFPSNLQPLTQPLLLILDRNMEWHSQALPMLLLTDLGFKQIHLFLFPKLFITEQFITYRYQFCKISNQSSFEAKFLRSNLYSFVFFQARKKESDQGNRRDRPSHNTKKETLTVTAATLRGWVTPTTRPSAVQPASARYYKENHRWSHIWHCSPRQPSFQVTMHCAK